MTIKNDSISKKPRPILENIFAFPPNRDTLGGTSYLVLHDQGNILIDCPLYQENNLEFCQQQGGIKYLFVTHRTAISKDIQKFQKNLNCQIIIQEQESYLLPNLTIETFTDDFTLNPNCTLIWTPGHTPGSSCLYFDNLGGVLFSGRHLLPNNQNQCIPLQVKKTFHWPRQLKSQAKVINLKIKYICPGGNTGYLKGKGFFEL